ncbi:MAG: hypothetical protein MZV70_68680 [Desulfobacterales bacterium]|nr:hypothetical protein [Desulfobacterales bacterium]
MPPGPNHASRVAADGHGGAVRVYVCEALGAAAGGVLLFPAAPERLPLPWSALAVSGVLRRGGRIQSRPLDQGKGRRSALMVASWCVAVALLLAAALNSEPSRMPPAGGGNGAIESLRSRILPTTTSRLLEESGFYSLFGNGLWYFSRPRPPKR